jgi:hypothetical protein
LDPAQRQLRRVGVKLARKIVSGTGRVWTRRSVSGAGLGEAPKIITGDRGA